MLGGVKVVVIIGGGVAIVRAEIADGLAEIVNGVPEDAAAAATASRLCSWLAREGLAFATVMGEGVAIATRSGLGLTDGWDSDSGGGIVAEMGAGVVTFAPRVLRVEARVEDTEEGGAIVARLNMGAVTVAVDTGVEDTDDTVVVTMGADGTGELPASVFTCIGDGGELVVAAVTVDAGAAVSSCFT